jgi:23S rRNA (cytidine1920-2'-O)/16S rRNA (cytidine1409-2'-O)-methyltransferase
MVRDGLADSRTRAQALIRAGQVLVDDTPHDKPGTLVRDESSVRVRAGRARFASRGGEKLAARSTISRSTSRRDCLDVGASTGGFTDCLLQRGARSVVAVDVGYGQLDARLRSDPRVHVRDRTNARHLEPDALPAPVSLVTPTCRSSRCASCARARALRAAADWLLLVKPQFEVGPEQVGKGGVVRDDALRAQAADAVARAAARSASPRSAARQPRRGPGRQPRDLLLLAPYSRD